MESYRIMNDGRIQRQSDLALIPPNESNADYLQYLVDKNLGAEVLPFDYLAENQRQEVETTKQSMREAAKLAKAQEIITNLPDWATVKTAINAAFPDTKQNNLITKALRVVFILARTD